MDFERFGIKSMILWRNAIEMQLQGLTLDIAGGNLLRLGKDGVILAASHGTRFTSNRRMFVFGCLSMRSFSVKWTLCGTCFANFEKILQNYFFGIDILIMTMIINYGKTLFWCLDSWKILENMMKLYVN